MVGLVKTPLEPGAIGSAAVAIVARVVGGHRTIRPRVIPAARQAVAVTLPESRVVYDRPIPVFVIAVMPEVPSVTPEAVIIPAPVIIPTPEVVIILLVVGDAVLVNVHLPLRLIPVVDAIFVAVDVAGALD